MSAMGEFRPDRPSLEAVRAHEACGGWWEAREIGANTTTMRFRLQVRRRHSDFTETVMASLMARLMMDDLHWELSGCLVVYEDGQPDFRRAEFRPVRPSGSRANPRTIILAALALRPLPLCGGMFTSSLASEVWFACFEDRPRAHKTPPLRVIKRHLHHLQRAGRVVRLADGRYALAPGSGEPYAVVIVVMRGSRVLLCQGPRWCLPGGKVERKRGEDAVHAAWREGKEELDVEVSLRGGEDGPDPFYRGHTHDGRTMWAYLGFVPDGTPDAWDAPEGRCEFVEVLASPALYRREWLAAFCRVMRALPDQPHTREAAGRNAHLLHLEECAQCQADPTRPCETGSWVYASAVEGVDDECE